MRARLFAALLPVLASTACGVGEADTPAQNAEPPLPVQIAMPREGIIHAWYRTSGHLEPEQQAAVVSRQPGEVIEILVEEGRRVVTGELLARLDARRASLEARRAQAALAKAEQALARQRALVDRGLVARGSVEELEFELQAQRAHHGLRRLELEQAEIRATIDGIVSRRSIKVGMHVNAGQVLFELTDPARLRIELPVPERELARLGPGQPAQLSVAALGGTMHPAVVQRLSPAVDGATGTLRLTLTVPNPTGRLVPGMFAHVAIAHDVRERALLIPSDAVVRDDGEAAVFVFAAGRAVRRSVSVGHSDGGLVEIRSGLSADEPIVTTAPATLRDGAVIVPAAS